MSRSRSVLAIPLLVLAMVGGGGLASAAEPAAAPAGFDCDTEGLGWPDRADVQGATFAGVIKGGYRVNFSRTTYRIKVARKYVGDFGSHVRISVQCVETRFAVGERVLISGGTYVKKDGLIARVVFSDHQAVAWRVVDSDGAVRLRGYGRGTKDAPEWAARPDTVRQAVRAVTPS